MSKTITVSDETYKLIKNQVESDEKDKTKIQIKTLMGEVLYESEKTTIKEAVVEAVGVDANLRGAYLKDANLRGANLGGADFFETKFYGKGGTTKINKSQINDFLKALGVIIQ